MKKKWHVEKEFENKTDQLVLVKVKSQEKTQVLQTNFYEEIVKF